MRTEDVNHEITQEHQEFVAALNDFKRATARLDAAWAGKVRGDILGDTYPECLPSFDEFACEVVGMEVQDA